MNYVIEKKRTQEEKSDYTKSDFAYCTYCGEGCGLPPDFGTESAVLAFKKEHKACKKAELKK